MRAAIVSFLVLLISGSSFCQKSERSSEDILARASTYLRTIHSESIKTHPYQGPEYYPVFVNREIDLGHPFFLRDSIQYDLLEYEGVQYVDVPLLFDLVQNKVVLVIPNTNIRISLVQENISRFTISGHMFVKIQKSLASQAKQKSSFYDLLYRGDKISLYAARKKVIAQSDHGHIVKTKYIDKADFYVLKNETLFLVKKKKDVLRLLADRHENLEGGLPSGHYSKKNFERFIVSACKAYEGL